MATEAKRVLGSLIFLAEKKVDKSVKARTCANSKSPMVRPRREIKSFSICNLSVSDLDDRCR